jgi:diaminohydroxyphosphoribosylaminopyrimidine deaminase/5-amino-6-(5-phosphoribosylamino)uracil reductase
VRRLREAGAEVLRVAGAEGVSIPAMLSALARRDVVSLLLEGGGTLAAAFLAARCIDRLAFYVAPKLLGGPGTTGALQGWAAGSIADAVPLTIESVRRMGPDVRVFARPT